MSDKATPRPWTASRHMLFKGNHNIGTRSNYRHVGEIWARDNEGESDANAELIVRAVNSHDQMVMALKQIARWPALSPVPPIHVIDEMRELARWALEGIEP